MNMLWRPRTCLICLTPAAWFRPQNAPALLSGFATWPEAVPRAGSPPKLKERAR